MSDFHVSLRVRNGRIVRRMRELGIKTFTDLARLSGTRLTDVSEILLFKRSPLRLHRESDGRDPDWTDAALGISSALHCEPEDLWPNHIAKLKAKRGEVSFFADADELRKIPANDTYVDRKLLASALSSLNERDREVLLEHHPIEGGDGATLREIGEARGRSVERTRQIEGRAIRKLEHPRHHLRDVLIEG